MTIEQPFSPNNPYQALSKFIETRLTELRINVERIGGSLIVYVDSAHVEFYGVPNEGTYVLCFNHEIIPSDLIKKLVDFRRIDINLNHPLVKKLSEDLDHVVVQSAEYKYENELDEYKFITWLQQSFKPIGLDIQTKKLVINKLEAIEIWFEISMKAGRGIFPVVLRKTKNDNAHWLFDEDFQKEHKKRRGGLIGKAQLDELVIEGKIGDEELREAIDIAFSTVKQKMQYDRTIDGAFLRQLRQLRIEQMFLSISTNGSSEVIEHYKRRIDQLKAEMQAQSKIDLNTIVCLYSTTSIELEITAFDKAQEKRFFGNGTWNSNNPDFLEIDFFQQTKQKQKIPLEQGMLVEHENHKPFSPLILGICPSCNEVRLEKEIRPFGYGTGSDCPKCRVKCAECSKSMSLDTRKKHSRARPEQWLCPDHAIICQVSGLVLKRDEIVLLHDGRTVDKTLAAKCSYCNELFLKTELIQHSINPTWKMDRNHAVTCDVTNKTVTPSELITIADGRHVLTDLTVKCCVHATQPGENPLFLKTDAKQHGFDDTRWMCNEHAALCEISSRYVEPSELVEVDEHAMVAIQITEPCYVCQIKKEPYIRHLRDQMKVHSFNKKYLCAKHAATCEVSGLIVTHSELVEIVSGKMAAIQLTDICDECDLDLSYPTRHLKKEMVTHSITGKMLCPRHAATCEISNNVVAAREVVEVATGQKVLYKYAEKCIDCEAIPGQNPYYLTTDLVQHKNGLIPNLYACKREHAFYCWNCGTLRPKRDFSGKTNDHAPLCKSCEDEWNQVQDATKPCALCENFAVDQVVSRNKDKCPRCNQNRLPMSKKALIPEIVQRKLTIPGNQGYLYTSKDPNGRFLLAVHRPFMFSPEWFLFEKDSTGNFLPKATSLPVMPRKRSLYMLQKGFNFFLKLFDKNLFVKKQVPIPATASIMHSPSKPNDIAVPPVASSSDKKIAQSTSNYEVTP
ncbi:MAG TPA: hypothetical protein VKM55_00485 [Candidatus Lokiarchaeia archaeon]|nr:hypothetical protein [Candidatus Lokiarchaeia archaeon]